MSFDRLHRGEMVALAAALCLLLVMALTWYSTGLAHEAQKIESQAKVTRGFTGEFDATLREDARLVVQSQQRSAWQPDSTLDWVGVGLLCLAAGSAIAAAFLRADGREGRFSLHPTAVAAFLGALAALFLMVRIIERPIAEAGTTVEIGAYLGLVCLGALTLGAALAARAHLTGAEDSRDARSAGIGQT